ncbi:hypothetical protein BaRGS_00023627 [Batillaria attramentaria]|uniref:Uncharacterized protein n=1 Tax=Batillaria attramentaria TaxID=370345 RepID=A0ABD0KDM0_9CAEN
MIDGISSPMQDRETRVVGSALLSLLPRRCENLCSKSEMGLLRENCSKSETRVVGGPGSENKLVLVVKIWLKKSETGLVGGSGRDSQKLIW